MSYQYIYFSEKHLQLKRQVYDSLSTVIFPTGMSCINRKTTLMYRKIHPGPSERNDRDSPARREEALPFPSKTEHSGRRD
jgi:hypothetical protein